MKIIEITIKKAKIIDIKHRYYKIKRNLLSAINLSDFLIIKAKGINGKTKMLKGTTAEMKAP